jgi:predicted nucleotidyltransferase
MDEKGFIFSWDAVLALIPVFVVITAIFNVNYSSLEDPNQDIRLSHMAEDSMNAMASYRQNNGLSLLENISKVLSEHQNDVTGIKEAGKIAGPFLDKTLKGVNYRLTEENQINKTITASADFKGADNVEVSSRSYGGYIFKLWVWE